jgi:alpha-L-fucosidase
MIRMLIDIASKGGNYLLNVGPTDLGMIPDASVERLADMGRWMKRNGESVYKTSASKFRSLPWGRSTTGNGKLYLHVFDWPKGQLLVPGLKTEVRRAYMLGEKSKSLRVDRASDGVLIRLPEFAPDPVASVVVVELNGKPVVETMPVRQARTGELSLTAKDAELHGGALRLQGEGASQNLGYWTVAADYPSWDVRIDRGGEFDVELTYSCEKGSGGSTVVLAIGRAKLEGTVEETGSWDTYKTVVLGRVRLPAGRHLATLKAPKMLGGAVMNLKSAVLKPIKYGSRLLWFSYAVGP